MAKKEKKDLDEVLSDLDLVPTIQTKEGAIAFLTHEFGREDLNLLRDKINELIARG